METKVVGVRLPVPVVELVDEAASRKGWTRSQWLTRLVERGLVGAGLMKEEDRG